jgi:hypothetical protein
MESWPITAPGRAKATIEVNCTTDTLCSSSGPLCYRTLRDYHLPSHSLSGQIATQKTTRIFTESQILALHQPRP